MARFGAALTSAIVIVVGVFTVLGLVVGDGLYGLSGLVSSLNLRGVASVFLQITVITIAFTILIGILNLLIVHFRRVTGRKGGWFYSLILVLSTLAVLILTVLERAHVLNGQPAPTTILLESVQVSVESALAGLVLFSLVYGAARILRRRVTGSGLLFTLVLLVLLVGALPLTGAGVLTNFRDWFLAIPVSAGARGILLGIALATVVTGVRVLIGQDRSYRE